VVRVEVTSKRAATVFLMCGMSETWLHNSLIMFHWCPSVDPDCCRALATPPTVITTGCAPAAIPLGTCTLSCVTPTSPEGMPIKSMVALTPPIVT
jgi:hypothetical protein